MIDAFFPHLLLLGDTTMNRKLRTLLVATAAGTMMTFAAGAFAQAPGGGPGGGARMGGGFAQPTDAAGVIQQFGLGDAALKITDAQKPQLNKAAEAYLAEMKTVNEKYPMTQGQMPAQEAMQARTQVRERFTAEVNKVLNEQQRKTWEEAQAARRGGAGRGGMGGPGGGMGGPGGARGPGGGMGPPPGGGPGGA